MPPSQVLWSSSTCRVTALAQLLLMTEPITQADSLPGNTGLGRKQTFCSGIGGNRDELAGGVLLSVTELGILPSRWKPTRDVSLRFSWMPDEYLSATVACSVLGFFSRRTRTRISVEILAQSLRTSQVMSRDINVLTQVSSQHEWEHPCCTLWAESLCPYKYS